MLEKVQSVTKDNTDLLCEEERSSSVIASKGIIVTSRKYQLDVEDAAGDPRQRAEGDDQAAEGGAPVTGNELITGQPDQGDAAGDETTLHMQLADLAEELDCLT